ncbi:hypothetical protein GcM3_02989 [Golovinomyces cichoracearum]|uniref:Uncharacterized protein n=1 Tax=Golovinomyces cichoracearum TaxID=62708 RepID=A0A420IU57_9PEZI|nr:hypothetical protein GcM3_02989 [Golovinomyces cichoracearum]
MSRARLMRVSLLIMILPFLGQAISVTVGDIPLSEQNTTIVTSEMPYSSCSNSSCQTSHISYPITSSTYNHTSSETSITKTGREEGCTSTLMRFAKLSLGPTKTIYEHTSTKTVYLDCDGCHTLVTEKIGGHGPVVFVTATAINPGATTTTTFACSSGQDEDDDEDDID